MHDRIYLFKGWSFQLKEVVALRKRSHDEGHRSRIITKKKLKEIRIFYWPSFTECPQESGKIYNEKNWICEKKILKFIQKKKLVKMSSADKNQAFFVGVLLTAKKKVFLNIRWRDFSKDMTFPVRKPQIKKNDMADKK